MVEAGLLEAFRQIVREEVERALSPHHAGAKVESMTVPEFAYVVRLHPDSVTRKIRQRSIRPEHVSTKAKAFRIKPAALEAFGISPAEAASRLAGFRAQSALRMSA